MTEAVRSLARLISGFLVWWLHELADCVPAPVLAVCMRRRDVIPIKVVADGLLVGEGANTLALPFNAEPRLPAGLASRIADGARPLVHLPSSCVLRRCVELPAAAESQLREAASFLVERHTPFRLDQACYAVRCASRDRRRKTLMAEIVVVAQPAMQRLVQALARHSLEKARFVLDDAPEQVLNFGERRDLPIRLAWRDTPSRLAMIALAVLMVGPLVIQVRLRHQADVLQARLVASAEAARRGAALRAAWQARLAEEAFLPRRRRDPNAAWILNAVSRAVPDDAWLFRLEITPGMLNLAGFSGDLPAMLQALQRVDGLGTPALRSPVLHGLADNRDRFDVDVALPATGR